MKNNGIRIHDWVSALSNQKLFFLAAMDLNGQLTFLNTHFLKRLHLTTASLIKNTFYDFIYADDLEIFKNAVNECQSSDKPVIAFVRIYNETNSWVKWEITPLNKTDSERVNFLCLGHEIVCANQTATYAPCSLDITEAYDARQEIKKTNEHLHYLSNATSEAIWDWNMQTGHIFCNQVLHDLIGSDLNDVFDLDWCYQCVHPDDRDKLKLRIKSVLDNKEQSWEMEYRFRNNDGSFKMICNRGFVMYENNEPIRMIGSLQDISVIKKLENQLLEQKLKQQKGIAEAIIQSQEEERTRIGHELHDNVNQILSTAQLYVSLLDPQKDNFITIKKKSMETILLGIEEIRILSKEMVIPTLRGDGLLPSINCIIDELRFIDMFNITFTHGNKCDVESLSKNKKITLYRIIQEQVKNIVKYSKARNVEISLDCINNQLRLFIQDDGIGFDSKNTKRGLGLSNIYERTRLDNGKVFLKTSPGHGCSLMINIAIDDKHIFSIPADESSL